MTSGPDGIRARPPHQGQEKVSGTGQEKVSGTVIVKARSAARADSGGQVQFLDHSLGPVF